MRTNIDIDDKLMKQAMKATGATTKKAAVEASMRLAVQLHKQDKALNALWGLGWEGNLDEMRADRIPTWSQGRESRQSNKQKSVA
ncbi:MAG: type II toxin-antitoxin system VapB family antitoxin [Terracidiphilus sp.]|jgi:Arc/MetJ family transcription regulator